MIALSLTQANACLPNISQRERRVRLISAVINFGLSVIILAALMALGVSRWWRLPLFLFFWAGAIGFFQWRDKT